MTWLEENSTVTEKRSPKTVSKKAAEKDSKPVSKTKSATKKPSEDEVQAGRRAEHHPAD